MIVCCAFCVSKFGTAKIFQCGIRDYVAKMGGIRGKDVSHYPPCLPISMQVEELNAGVGRVDTGRVWRPENVLKMKNYLEGKKGVCVCIRANERVVV